MCGWLRRPLCFAVFQSRKPHSTIQKNAQYTTRLVYAKFILPCCRSPSGRSPAVPPPWCIVDVKGAIEVDGDEHLAAWNIGTWTLAVDGNGVATKTGSGEAEVSVGVTELTSLWTALPPRRGHGDELSEWELLQARDSGALAKAQHRFAIPKQPFCMDDW
jgi:hypothetical protein